MSQTQTDPIVIIAAQRTPTGKFNGQFRNTPSPELGAMAIKSALEKSGLTSEMVNAVFMGCVLPAGLGQAPARQAALAAGILQKTPCVTVNKVCGSSMQTVIYAHDSILAGTYDIVVAGGMENMTRAPYLLPKERFGQRFGHGKVLDHMLFDGLEDVYEAGKPMGYFAEKCAEKYAITRAQQDQFAQASIERARQAIKNNQFSNEIISCEIKGDKGESLTFNEDEGPFSVDPAKIPKLPPAFAKNGTITAANSSSISDGAAALVLTRKSIADKLSIKPLATIVGHFAHAQEPEWFTTAPISAINGLMAKLQWGIVDVDLFEINEAFAVVPLVAMQALSIPHEKINVHGGACILGHPLGASGARILVTLIHALHTHKLKRGIASLCIGGGEATAIALEVH